MLLVKPNLAGELQLQEDHYERVCDLAFRHLGAAYENSRNAEPHRWIREINNDDPRYGRLEYLVALRNLLAAESEEYSHVLAALIFAHTWVLSAANFYRLSGQALRRRKQFRVKIHRTDNPEAIASALRVAARVVSQMTRLHRLRNTIMHLVEGTKHTERIDKLRYSDAYTMLKSAWIVYCAVMRNCSEMPVLGAWRYQTKRYRLPPSLKCRM
jgi:hypothetical protein